MGVTMLSKEAIAVTPLPSAALEPENSPISPSLPAARVQGTPRYIVSVSSLVLIQLLGKMGSERLWAQV